eukprot:6486995-Amphidinium_carterae.3
MKYNVRIMVMHRDSQQAWALVPTAVELVGWTHFLWLQGQHYWHTEAMDTLEAIQHALDGGLEQSDDIQQALQISLAGGGFQKVTGVVTLAMLGHTIDAAMELGKKQPDAQTHKTRRVRKHDDFHLASSNVTSWGFAELQYDAWAMEGRHALAPHVWCVQEHHRSDGAFDTMINQCDRWGYSCYGVPAVQKNAGTWSSAGVAVLVKKYVAASPVGTAPELLKGRVAAVRAAVAGGVTVVSAYLTVGASAAQRLDELEALAAFVFDLPRPFVVAADFNVPVEQIQALSWPDHMGAVLCATTQPTLGTARIDALVVAEELVPQFKGVALDDWTLTRPHKTIRTRFAFRPPSTLVQVPSTHAPDISTLEYGPCLADPEAQPIWEEGHIPEVGAAWQTWSYRAAQ